MADGSRPGPDDGTDAPGPPGIPRWVRVSAAVALALLVLLGALLLVTGGEHGPQQHFSGTSRTDLAPAVLGHGA